MSLSLSDIYETKMGKHRKWEDIVVLEVQDVGEGLHHFSSRDIQWTPICVKNDSTTDLCATIPLGRLDAFIRGELLHEGVETKFLRKRQSEHDSAMNNTHTTKIYSQYWCSYGPEDNRKKSSNKKHARTYQKKRGCTCHFIVKVLNGRPDVAILILKQPLHVDKNGEACHGMDDTSNELCSQFAPKLSDECKAYIERLLRMDASVDAIMDKHLDDPIFHDMLKKKDSFVTRKDVINVAMTVHSIRSRKHMCDATSILEWKKQDEANFFFSSNQKQSGVPVAWVVTLRNKIEDIQVWLMELWRRAKEKRPDWGINAFIMDDASAKIHVIE
ncbi:hypothetical protein SUGI_0208570 [Cryptomeria japonica]|nr:hypothetical protein SUGI_0208570 [Cryptomeria japonica]